MHVLYLCQKKCEAALRSFENTRFKGNLMLPIAPFSGCIIVSNVCLCSFLYYLYNVSYSSLLMHMVSFQIENMKFKDKRLKIMNEILNGIKVSTIIQLFCRVNSPPSTIVSVRSPPLLILLCKNSSDGLVEVGDFLR